MFDKKLKAFFTTKSDGNIAYHVVDKNSYFKVDKNRAELEKTYNIDMKNLKYMDQVHGAEVIIVGDKEKYTCDGLITNKKNTPLMIMSADCIGILFYDPIQKVIAVAHAGRNSTFLEISKKTILKMQKEFCSKAKDIKISMGPSIQKCCYEVSQEMADIVKTNFGQEFVSGRYIDLQGINKKQVLDMGVDEKNIKISKVCTKCSNEDYFSYRLDNSCGRFAGLISLL